MHRLLALLLCAAFVSGCVSYSVRRESLANVKTVVFLQFKMNASCETRNDRMKYLNTQIYAEAIATNFLREFGAINRDFVLVPIKDAVEEKVYRGIKGFLSCGSNTAVAQNTIDTDCLGSNEINALAAALRADAYGTVVVDCSLWAQYFVFDFTVRNASGDIVFHDRVRSESTYIIRDIDSPYTSDFEVFPEGDRAAADRRYHQDEIIIVIREAAASAAREIAAHIRESLH